MFSEMIDDGYIHWNLLRHMLKAGLIGLAQKLVTDLRWLGAKLSITGPADLLNDYLSIKGQVDNKVWYLKLGNLNSMYNYGAFLNVFKCTSEYEVRLDVSMIIKVPQAATVSPFMILPYP